MRYTVRYAFLFEIGILFMLLCSYYMNRRSVPRPVARGFDVSLIMITSTKSRPKISEEFVYAKSEDELLLEEMEKCRLQVLSVAIWAELI